MQAGVHKQAFEINRKLSLSSVWWGGDKCNMFQPIICSFFKPLQMKPYFYHGLVAKETSNNYVVIYF